MRMGFLATLREVFFRFRRLCRENPLVMQNQLDRQSTIESGDRYLRGVLALIRFTCSR